jgi:hypothetical protein
VAANEELFGDNDSLERTLAWAKNLRYQASTQTDLNKQRKLVKAPARDGLVAKSQFDLPLTRINW